MNESGSCVSPGNFLQGVCRFEQRLVKQVQVCAVWGMAKALFSSRKSSGFNIRAQIPSEKQALLFCACPCSTTRAGARCHLCRVGTPGETAEVALMAQSCCRNAPAELLRSCQCEEESDGHPGGLQLPAELKNCLGKESPALQGACRGFWCSQGAVPSGTKAAAGRDRQIGTAQSWAPHPAARQ